MFIKKFVLGFILMAAFSPSVFSQEGDISDVPEVPRGIYTGIYTGMIFFLDETDRALFDDGWLVGFKLGYDIFKYLQVEARFGFSGHNSSPEGSSNTGIPRSFMAYQAQGFIRGGYPVLRRLTLTGDIGGGLWYTDPNQKANIGSVTRGMLSGGIGVQYFIRMKGLSMGLEPTLSVVQDLEGVLATVSGYVRYTF